jgi:hypothetical protein
MRARLVALCLPALLAVAKPAHAQGFIEDLFRQVDRVGFHVPSLGNFTGDTLEATDDLVGGLGLRVSFTLVRGKCLGAKNPPFRKCEEPERERSSDEEIESIGDSVPGFEVYLQLEYNRLSGISDNLAATELRGSFVEFPTIGVYALHRLNRTIGIYSGVHVGLTKLEDFQAFDDFDNVYRGESTSFSLGANAGLVVGVTGVVQSFIEVNYTRRQFNSVRWGVPDGTPLPSELPRGMPAHSSHMRGGLQIVLP